MSFTENRSKTAVISLYPVTVTGGGENYTKNCALSISKTDGFCDLFYPRKAEIGNSITHIFQCSVFSEKGLISENEITFRGLLQKISSYEFIWIHQYLSYPEIYDILISTNSSQKVLFTNLGLEMNAADFWCRYEKFPNHFFVEVSSFSASRARKYIKNASFEYGGIWENDLKHFLEILPSKKKNRFVSIGRVLPHKAFEITIEALAKYQHLDILGPKNIHPTYQKMLNLRSIFKDVNFLGYISEDKKLKILAESIALIASSSSKTLSGKACENSELLGLVILEAIVAGTLPITSCQPAFQEIMTKFQLSDLIYPERDVATLREKMDFVSQLSLERYLEYLENARAILVESFLWDNYWPRVQNALSKTVISLP